MKTLTTLLLAATSIGAPAAVYAKDATITVAMQRYAGPASYVAIYVTDAAGKYQSTLYVAGSQMRYFRHLREWYRDVSNVGSIDGVTGASVGSGQTLKVDVRIADALIDNGYEVHVDDAVENGSEYSRDLILPLKSNSAGLSAKGAGYVRSLNVSF
jgi:hypothetical protein